MSFNFQEHRNELQSGGGIDRFKGQDDIAFDEGCQFVYQNGVKLDALFGKNLNMLDKELDKLSKLIDAKTNMEVMGDFEEDTTIKVKVRKDIMIPFTLDFDDGQVITAWVSNIGDNKNIKVNKPMHTAMWFLNKKNITKMVSQHTNDLSSLSTALSTLVNGNSAKFKVSNPQISSNIDEITKKINNLKIDTSNVIIDIEEAPKVKPKEEKQEPKYQQALSDDDYSKIEDILKKENIDNKDVEFLKKSMGSWDKDIEQNVNLGVLKELEKVIGILEKED